MKKHLVLSGILMIVVLTSSVAFAGQGFKIYIHNKTDKNVIISHLNHQCWYVNDFGGEGNIIVPSQTTKAFYTEGEESGLCSTSKSTQNIKLLISAPDLHTYNYSFIIRYNGQKMPFEALYQGKVLKAGTEGDWIRYDLYFSKQ
jgi:hypothetical protein